MLTYQKSILVFLLALLLTACGFHPRGQIPLAKPLKNMYLQTDNPYGQLSRSIKQYLKMSGVNLTSSPQQATIILHIIQESLSKDLVSYNSSQQTRQYNLKLTVVFDLQDAQGKILMPPYAVKEERSLTLQSSQVLAGGNEAALLIQQMQRDIVFDIMSRISSKDVSKLISP